MKKWLLTVMGAGVLVWGFAGRAAEQTLSFGKLWRTGATEVKQSSIKTASVLFKIQEEGSADTYLMIQTERPGKIRFDMTSGQDVYAAVLDNDKAWSWSLENGTVGMDKASVDEIEMDAAVMFWNYGAAELFETPKFVKEENVNGEMCLEYETCPADRKDQHFHFWVSKETKLPVKSMTSDDAGLTVMFFREYQDCDGVKLPAVIQMADDSGIRTLKLQKAAWNVELAKDRFEKPTQALSSEWAKKLMEKQQEKVLKDAKKTVLEKSKMKAEEAALSRKIQRLKLEIESETEMLKKMEETYDSNRQSIASVTQEPAPVVYRSYWRHGYGYYASPSRSYRHAAKRLVRRASKENDKLVKEYREENQKLLNKKLELGDLEAQLKKLQENLTE